MDKTHLEKSEATNKISSNTTGNSKEIVEKANEHPEWLPDGWRVDVKFRKSGALMGAGYKCYIDPLSGLKFYSKPEVLRYLDTIKANSSSSEKEKRCAAINSQSNVATEMSTVGDLLPGSTKEAKTRKNSSGIKKDTAAAEKSTTDILPSGSTKEVDIRKNSNGIRKDPVTVEKSTVNDLPPGWTKEVKIRKNRNGIRKDPYYTDPVNGYVFRSKKDALRYVESGDISRCLFKSNKRQIQDEDNSTTSSTAKRQKLKQPAAKRQLFVGKEVSGKSSLELLDANSSEKVHDVKLASGMMIVDTVVKMHSLEEAPAMNQNSDPADVQEKNYVLNAMENTGEKNNHSSPSISKNKKGSNVPHRFSRRLAGIEPGQVADPDRVIDEQSLPVPKRSLRKSGNTLDVDLANESAQQLNVIPKIEHVDEIPQQSPKEGSKLSECQGDFRERPNQLETEKIEDNKAQQHEYSLSHDYSSSNLKHAMNTTGEIAKIDGQEKRSSNKKDHRVPCRASKRLAGFEPEISNSMDCDKPPEYMGRKFKGEVNADSHQSEDMLTKDLGSHASTYISAPRNGESSSKRGKKSPKIPPRTSEQLEKLGDEQLDDEKSEPQLSFAFHYSWSDPCVEFAIKTLTGVLPVEDSVDNGPVLVPETELAPKNKFSIGVTEGSNDKNPQVTSKNGPLPVPETGVVHKDKLSKSVIDGSSDKNPQVTSKNGPVLVPETEAVQKDKLSKSITEASNDKNPHVTSKNGPVLVPEIEVVQKDKLSRSVTEGSNDNNPQVTSKKSKNKKELILPRRLSKRLAGHEPEVLPAERALEYAARKFCKNESTVDATSGNGASNNLDVAQVSCCSERRVHGEPSNKSEQSYEAQIVPHEQLQKFEAEKVHECSKPAAATSGDGASNNLDVVQVSDCSEIRVHGESSNESEQSCETEIVPGEQLQKFEAEKVLESSEPTAATSGNGTSNNLDVVQVSDCSKRVNGESSNKSKKSYEAQIVPGEQLQKFEAEKVHESSAPAVATSGNGTSNNLDAVQVSDCSERVHGEPSNKSEKSYEAQIDPSEQLPKVEAEKIDERSEPQLSLPFGDSWSDPCLEFAIKTLTGALPVDSAADILPIMTPDINCPPNKGLLESVVEKCISEEAHDNLNQSQKSEDIDSQPSEQLLAQPELMMSPTSCENAPKLAIRESSADEANITKNLDERGSQHSKSTDMAGQPSKQLLGQPDLKTSSISCENSPKFATEVSYSNETDITRNLPVEAIDMACQPSKQLPGQPELRTSSTSCENTPKFTTLRESYGGEASISKIMDKGESLHNEAGWSDLKTSSISCENSPKFATEVSYSNETNITRNLPIEAIDMACQPSKQLPEQPELRTSSTSCENTPKFTTLRESSCDEAIIFKNLDKGESLHTEAGNESQLAHQSRNMDKLIQEEPSNIFAEVFEEGFPSAEQPQLETQTKNQEKSELQFSAPFMDSWSDPCLEFAFKTLTGAIPVEENLAMQGCFPDPADNFPSHRDASSMFPDFGSPSFSQSDISFHYNVEKSMPESQSSMSPSILPSEKVNPLCFAGFDSQNCYSQCSKNSQGR